MPFIYAQSKHDTHLTDLSTRLLAFSLDVLLLLTLIGIADYFTFSSNDQALFLKPERLLHLVLAWLYFAGTEVCPCQGTLGKYLMQVRVTNLNGKRISFKAATIRFLARPVTALILVFRFLVGTYQTSGQIFHDRLSGTLVVEQ